ncbi:MAG: hypothetical protein IJ187_02940 [Neisseriaceae bacterium]|nr:hypothetical protein [Neisseriaceae bacterium]
MKFKICLLAAVMSVVAVANADYKALQTVNYQSYGNVFSNGLQTVEIDGAFCVIAKFTDHSDSRRSSGGIAMQCDFNDKYKANRTQPKKQEKQEKKDSVSKEKK